LKVDLFTNGKNAQLAHRYTANDDAMAMVWPESGAYANPPWEMISAVLKKVRQEKVGRIVVVTPVWHRTAWFRDAEKMCLEVPVLLGRRKDLFLADGKVVGEAKWDSMVWVLTGADGHTSAWKYGDAMQSLNNLTEACEERASWLADSGASSHFAGDRSWFRNYKPVTSVQVRLGNNSVRVAAGRGDVHCVTPCTFRGSGATCCHWVDSRATDGYHN